MQTSQKLAGTSWDQFSVNKEKFGIETGFNESLYTVPMSSLPMSEDEWREVVDAAKDMELEEGMVGWFDFNVDNGRGRISTELSSCLLDFWYVDDGEEDSILYSDVKVHKDNQMDTGDELDSFVDSNIRKQ